MLWLFYEVFLQGYKVFFSNQVYFYIYALHNISKLIFKIYTLSIHVLPGNQTHDPWCRLILFKIINHSIYNYLITFDSLVRIPVKEIKAQHFSVLCSQLTKKGVKM